jgi:hypothetical protein
MADFESIIAAIDDLIAAKLSGATDLDQVADKRIGDLGINRSATIKTLMELRREYVQLQTAEDPYAYGQQTILWR